MISEKLQEARDFEKAYGPYVKKEERPAFHVTGAIGWINDPNGFSVYKNEYHLFFQYHPYTVEWGPMHWGHVKTKDFIKWENLPCALAPDTEADCNGCFSGSAVELPDGRQMLVYTGVYRERRVDGKMVEYQRQCVAFGDGVDYEKYEGNPVLTFRDLPSNGDIYDFRDPKVWIEDDGSYRMVVGNRTDDGSGAILMYRSENGTDWSYVTTIDACHNQYGRMWECPDFFELDGKQVLIVSPQEMQPMGYEFHAGYGVVCLIGDYDKKTNKFKRQRVQSIDYGIDFYAPQTLLTLDGRRVMIGWMQNWTTTNCRPYGCRIFGQMSIPREISIVDGRLIQNPVRELENYRKNHVHYENILIENEETLIGVHGRLIDMTVNVTPSSEMNCYRYFKIKVCMDGEHETVIRYKPETSTLRVDRSRSGFPYDIVHMRGFRIKYQNGAFKIRIVMDKNCLEVFVNDGEQAASFMVYTPLEAQSIRFESEGGPAVIDVDKYDLVF